MKLSHQNSASIEFPKPHAHSPRFHHLKSSALSNGTTGNYSLSLNNLHVPVSTIHVTYNRNAPYSCHLMDKFSVIAAAQIFSSTFTISICAQVQWTDYSILLSIDIRFSRLMATVKQRTPLGTTCHYRTTILKLQTLTG